MHGDVHVTMSDNSEILEALTAIGEQLVTLQSSFDEFKSGVVADYQNVVSQRDDLAQQLLDAMSNDAAQQADIDAKRSEIEAMKTETQSVIDQMSSFDLDPSNPAAPPEPAPTPEPAPPGGGGEVPPDGGGGNV